MPLDYGRIDRFVTRNDRVDIWGSGSISLLKNGQKDVNGIIKAKDSIFGYAEKKYSAAGFEKLVEDDEKKAAAQG
ncbi:MAG: hypothetical protein WA817_15730 [Candidatus Acidiferrum sp.]